MICVFFVWAMIYETKGLSLEEVDELYEKVNKAWKSDNFVPSTKFRVGDKNTAGVGDGEELKADVPVVDHGSEHTEVNGTPPTEASA